MNTIKLNTIGEGPAKPKAQEGGGGDYVYYLGPQAVLETYGLSSIVYGLSSIVRVHSSEGIAAFLTPAVCTANGQESNFIAIGFDASLKFTNLQESAELAIITIGESIIPILDQAGLIRITEEQFYGILPAYCVLSAGTSHVIIFDEGMTWREWINSDYNTIGVYVYEDKQMALLDNNGNLWVSEDIIDDKIDLHREYELFIAG